MRYSRSNPLPTLVTLGLLAGLTARGFINPKFTPVELTKEAQQIAVVVFESDPKTGIWRCASLEVVKGRMAGFRLHLDEAKIEERPSISKLFEANGGSEAILFAAKTDAGLKGYFHLGSQWFAARGRDDGDWLVESFAPQLSGTWAGGTDMLIRQTRYLLEHPGDHVPVTVGTTWLKTQAEIAKLNAPPTQMTAVELSGIGLCVMVALPEGDRIFRAKPNDEAFEEITGSTRLRTRSKIFSWGDLDGDGQLELAS